MKNTILITAFLIAVSITSVAVKADSDIDFDDGVLYIETDSHDDLIIMAPVDGRLEVCILQMDEQFFDTAGQIFDFYATTAFMTLEEIHDTLEDIADEDRYYRRDFDEIHTIVVNSGSGDDGVLLFDPNGVMPFIRTHVLAGAGNDLIFGERHRLSLYGQGGEDMMIARDPLSSYISGGDDDDAISHDGTNSTTIDGGLGDDIIDCYGTGRVYACGGVGNDEILGGSGNDRIYGGDGNDIIEGNEGNDKLYGNDGVDTISGGSGNDFLEGGYDGFIDFLPGGSGFDTGIYKYFRYASSRFPSKNLMRTLEEEEVYSIENKSGRQK